MNDSLEDIEAELARLEPGPTAGRLNRRVAETLETPAAPALSRAVAGSWRLRAVHWAVAAVIFTLAGALAVRWLNPPTLSTTTTGVRRAERETAPTVDARGDLRRLGEEHYLVDARDRGVIYTSADTPWRKVTWQYVSVSEWRDDRSKSTVQVFVPRQETVVMPVNLR